MFTSRLASSLFNFATFHKTAKEAVQGIHDGSLLLVGGFGICGVPMNLIHAVQQQGVKQLTCVSNNCGFGDKEGKKEWGLSILLRTRQVKRMISSYLGENYEFERQYMNGELELEICPQGSLAERIRAGGAGIPAFYTATGVGTVLEEGGFPIKFKQGTQEVEIASKPRSTAIFNNKKYLMEEAIFGDYALVKAYKADTAGNLIFHKTARNFNADMCTAAKCVIAEVEEIVEAGQIDPDHVHIPGVYVDRVYLADPNSPFSQKRIQKMTLNQPTSSATKDKDNDLRLKIIKRASKQVRDGMNVNLGIGIPTLLPSVLPPNVKINLQSENGIFGVGPYPTKEQLDADIINAGKETITLLPGASIFSSAQSFAVIRGGHLDLTMLGAMQVSETCDIANWIIPKKLVKGMGGAMDLVACGSKVIVVMEHNAKGNSFKLLPQCSLPLTAKGVVSMVITELAVFENQNGKLVLTEIAEGKTLEEVQQRTGFPLNVAKQLKTF